MSTAALDPTRNPLRHDAQVIGLVGLAHGVSHFYHLLLAPLFPWIKAEFGLSYAELGLLMTVFFAVSAVVQTASGFVVDRFGARPVLFAGLAFLGAAALLLSTSSGYAALLFGAAVAGLGNGVFHPADFTLLNKHVSQPRLGHAFSVHGISGNLGWAAAPLFLVAIANLASWRVALAAASAVAFIVLAVLVVLRHVLDPSWSPAALRNPTPTASMARARRSANRPCATAWSKASARSPSRVTRAAPARWRAVPSAALPPAAPSAAATARWRPGSLARCSAALPAARPRTRSTSAAPWKSPCAWTTA